MIIYKVEDKPDSDINAQLREIATELATISPTLQKLQSIVSKHEATISSPSITEFRSSLQRMVNDATNLNQRISQNSLMLIEVSEQASKHLTSIERHYGALLRDKTPVNYLTTMTVSE